ncbi:hypothetical protein RHMOL_Rhmol03G0123200 [Rhododendron molle]|uniref:Uncharacterized protein n=1 Tax=Rhododendron molle TaxID=49168 RepID=A0ACC0PD85_RHOML|nr:hypothetical protein RHMOL_Rhmol03G0123200 [Rhododendron molle]
MRRKPHKDTKELNQKKKREKSIPESDGVSCTGADFIHQPRSPTLARKDASNDHDLQGTTSKSRQTTRRKRQKRGRGWRFQEEGQGMVVSRGWG